jgi:uncharacterized membrane protein YhaH (DUF805 family)
VLHWYPEVLKKYAVFSGRAGRPEYWWFALASAIISLLLTILVGVAISGAAGQGISALYSLAVLLPTIGVGIRRLHDTNHSGWWMLIGLIPVVGWIWVIILYASRGNEGPNRYGPPPGAAASTMGARFDAATGRPVIGYDPHTGEPILGERDR